jgi:hypothetical protein
MCPYSKETTAKYFHPVHKRERETVLRYLKWTLNYCRGTKWDQHGLHSCFECELLTYNSRASVSGIMKNLARNITTSDSKFAYWIKNLTYTKQTGLHQQSTNGNATNLLSEFYVTLGCFCWRNVVRYIWRCTISRTLHRAVWYVTTKISDECTASIIRERWWRQWAPLELRSVSTRLHGATSQKTANCALIVVRTWNVTFTHLLISLKSSRVSYESSDNMLSSVLWYREGTQESRNYLNVTVQSEMTRCCANQMSEPPSDDKVKELGRNQSIHVTY